MLNLGTVPASSTLYIPFATYGGTNGESITLTGLAVTDIEIYKNGSVTQRASDAGYTLLDTDGIDFDGITGVHGFSIDLSDNTDSGFYAVGSFYWVVVSAVTVDSQTVNFIAAVFRIGPAEVVAGYPVVDAGAISGDTTAANNAESFFDGTGYAGTNNVIPTVTNVTNLHASAATASALATAQADLDTLTGADGATLATSQPNYAPATASALTTVSGKVDTAQADLDILTGTDGATLATSQPNYAPATAAALSTVSGKVDTAQADLDTLTGADGATLATSQPNYAPATAAALATAQTDLDTLTGADGALIDSTAQGTFVDAVWNEAQSGHTTAGTFGKYLDSQVSAISAGSGTPELVGVVTRSGSTYYTSWILRVSGAMVTSGLSSLVCTFHDEDGTNLTFSGTPAETSGFMYASGTLGTALTDNRPLMVKIGATYSGTPYSTVLTAVAVVTS